MKEEEVREVEEGGERNEGDNGVALTSDTQARSRFILSLQHSGASKRGTHCSTNRRKHRASPLNPAVTRLN